MRSDLHVRYSSKSGPMETGPDLHAGRRVSSRREACPTPSARVVWSVIKVHQMTLSLHSAMHAGQVSKVENCQKKRQAAVAVREQVGAAADDDAPGSSSDGSSSGRDAGPCSPGAWDHVPQPSARCERASVAECSRAVTTQRCHRGRLAHQRHRRERRRLRRCSQTHQEACRSTAAASDSSTVACGGREL